MHIDAIGQAIVRYKMVVMLARGKETWLIKLKVCKLQITLMPERSRKLNINRLNNGQTIFYIQPNSY